MLGDVLHGALGQVDLEPGRAADFHLLQELHRGDVHVVQRRALLAAQCACDVGIAEGIGTGEVVGGVLVPAAKQYVGSGFAQFLAQRIRHLAVAAGQCETVAVTAGSDDRGQRFGIHGVAQECVGQPAAADMGLGLEVAFHQRRDVRRGDGADRQPGVDDVRHAGRDRGIDDGLVLLQPVLGHRGDQQQAGYSAQRGGQAVRPVEVRRTYFKAGVQQGLGLGRITGGGGEALALGGRSELRDHVAAQLTGGPGDEDHGVLRCGWRTQRGAFTGSLHYPFV